VTAAAAVPATGGAPERADFAAWLACAAGTLGAFMALLDVSIVNASLPIIQGEIGATQSEGTWVGTSYLVAEIVVMPLTAWLERLLSLRRVLLIGATIFTIFSVICGFADDLTTMIAGRIGQGLAGGTLIPTGMTIMAKRLPPSQQSIGISIFASAALLGPILGPLVGGYITESFSWNYIFFINVPICTGLVVLILAGLPKEPGDPHELVNADLFGVAGMMLGLGSLTVLLEEGHREQWFESPLIWKLAITSVVGFGLVAVGQLRSARPVIKLSLLRDRGLTAALVLMMVCGAILFCTLFVTPQFLVAIAGYNASQAGRIVFLSGAFSMLAALCYPALIARLDIRLIVAVSFVTTATACIVSTDLTVDSVGSSFIAGQLLLGFGCALTAIPLQQAAISAVPVEEAGQATSLFNISRNLGASIGLAATASFFDQRTELHHWRLQESLAANDPDLHQRLVDMSARFGGGSEGISGALRMIDAAILRQSLVLSFADIFFVMAICSIVALPLLLLLKPIDPERAQSVGAH